MKKGLFVILTLLIIIYTGKGVTASYNSGGDAGGSEIFSIEEYDNIYQLDYLLGTAKESVIVAEYDNDGRLNEAKTFNKSEVGELKFVENDTDKFFKVFLRDYENEAPKSQRRVITLKYWKPYDITWSLSDDGVLTISGNGKMEDYEHISAVPWTTAPWMVHRNEIKAIVIEEGITHIGSYAFAHCNGAKIISIPESVTSIGENAFEQCIGKEIHITNVVPWCNISFENEYSNPCYSSNGDLYLNGELITDLVIPEGVTSIGAYAFENCDAIKSVSFPQGLTYIGKSAFEYCTALTEIVLPDSVTALGDQAFKQCINLKNIKLSERLTSIPGYTFSYCSELTDMEIPDSVTEIGVCAFECCWEIDNITLGNNLSYIGFMAFFDCDDIINIVIPESVKQIEADAFKHCSYLETIYYEGTEEEWDSMKVDLDIENLNENLSDTSVICNYKQ